MRFLCISDKLFRCIHFVLFIAVTEFITKFVFCVSIMWIFFGYYQLDKVRYMEPFVPEAIVYHCCQKFKITFIKRSTILYAQCTMYNVQHRDILKKKTTTTKQKINRENLIHKNNQQSFAFIVLKITWPLVSHFCQWIVRKKFISILKI